MRIPNLAHTTQRRSGWLQVILLPAVLLLTLPEWVRAAHPEDHFAELRELLRHASENAPSLEMSAYRVEEAEGERMAAHAANKPRVHANVRGALSLEQRSDVDSLETRGLATAGLQLRQPLYYWGATEATRQVGSLRLEQAELEAMDARLGLTRELRMVYLELVMARDGLRLLESSAATAREMEATQSELVREGSLPEVELLESRITLYDYEEQLVQAKSRVRRLEDRLVLLSGDERARKLGQVSFPEITPLTPDELHRLRERIDHTARPPVTVLREEVALRMEQENHRVIRSSKRPLVDLVAGISQDQLESVGQAQYEYRVLYFAGLQVSWNLFDGRETRGRELSSLARQRLLELRAEESRQRHRQELMGVFEDLQQNLQQMLVRDRRDELAKQRLQLREDLAERGQVSRIDLLRDRLHADDVRMRALRARVDYLLNLSRIHAALTMELGTPPN